MGPSDAVGFNEERRYCDFVCVRVFVCGAKTFEVSLWPSIMYQHVFSFRRGRGGNRQVGQWDAGNERKRDNHERDHIRERDHGPRGYDGGPRPAGPNNVAGKRGDWDWDGRGRYAPRMKVTT